MSTTYTKTSETTWDVRTNQELVGTITQTRTGYLCKGLYFEVELSQWEYAKSVFVPTDPQKPNTIKENQPTLW